MNRPCPITIDCPGSDSPFGNFSSEAPDPFLFSRFAFPIFDPNNPIGGHRPPVPPVYFAGDCAGICTSTVSQEDADLCAARQAYICDHTPPDGGTPPAFFFSHAAFCSLPCGSGSIFFWQVPAGAFVGTTQAGADEQAQAYACLQAARHAFCLNDIPTEAQVGAPYSATIFVNGADRPPVAFSVVSGALPDGLTLVPDSPESVFLHGTPTKGGTFNFTIQARDALGIIVTRAYTITVSGQICADFWTSMAAQMAPNCFPPPLGVCGASFAGNVAHLSGTSGGTNSTAFFPSGVQGTSANPTESALTCSASIIFTALANPAQVTYFLQVINSATFATYLDTGFVGASLGVTTYNFTIPAGVNVIVTMEVLIQDLVPIASYDAFVILGN